MIKYFFVNGLTLTSLSMGVIAIYYSLQGFLYFSFGLALVAFIFDIADGYYARKLNSESLFGAIFDTISDIIVYLIYPSVVLYNLFGVNNFFGVMAISIFLFSGFFRLIRFTLHGFELENDKKYYNGLPVVFSHLVIIFMMFINAFNHIFSLYVGVFLLLLLSIFMVSNIKIRKPLKKYLLFLACFIMLLSVIMFII